MDNDRERSTLIFADVHLKVTPDGQQTLDEFVRFLRGISSQRYERVIVLGDLFEFWFEYKHVIFSEYFEVLRAFAELNDQGIDLHLISGNHDFWAGRFLTDHLGFTVHREPFECTLGDKRVRFVHGDGVNPKDRSYRFYKRIARSRLVVWLFGLLHPDWAMAIASRVARGSRTLRSPKDPSQGPEVIPIQRFAQGILEAGEADVVICGHSHYAQRMEFPTPSGTGEYINTGDWMLRRDYVEWNGETFELARYEAKQ